MQDLNIIILAGGVGRRLAPISTDEKPKQFHDLLGSGKSLLQETAERALGFAEANNIYTIGNLVHRELLDEQLRSLDESLARNVILEPCSKNTAASIFLAANMVKSGLMVILPSDHYIKGGFENDIIKALRPASEGKIVTFGIVPTMPSVNYGYILNDNFIEKPSAKTAQNLIEQGAVWNSGIFVAKAETILQEFRRFHPEFFDSEFKNLPSLPFDKAVMEKTDKTQMLRASFEWDDLGSFESLKKYTCLDSLIAAQ